MRCSHFHSMNPFLIRTQRGIIHAESATRRRIFWWAHMSRRTLTPASRRLRDGEAPPRSSWDDFMWSRGGPPAQLQFFLVPPATSAVKPFPLSFKTAAEQHGSGPDAIIYFGSILDTAYCCVALPRWTPTGLTSKRAPTLTARRSPFTSSL